jgi:hypothetical protein
VFYQSCLLIALYYLARRSLIQTRGADASLCLSVAFILYRQHYQAQVVAQHPGLANPEISKIIGEQWREQAPEIKSDWKRLAEVRCGWRYIVDEAHTSQTGRETTTSATIPRVSISTSKGGKTKRGSPPFRLYHRRPRTLPKVQWQIHIHP